MAADWKFKISTFSKKTFKMNVQYRYPLQIYTLGDEVAKLTQDSKVYRVGHASDPCVVLRYEGDRKKTGSRL